MLYHLVELVAPSAGLKVKEINLTSLLNRPVTGADTPAPNAQAGAPRWCKCPVPCQMGAAAGPGIRGPSRAFAPTAHAERVPKPRPSARRQTAPATQRSNRVRTVES